MAVDAPFRFARVNRWVHFPEGTESVSHDVPFRDGISGEIHINVTAQTPLLVGGARRKGVKGDRQGGDRSGEVWPVVTHDGRWAIPGTSFQGLIRSLLEVVSFAKLGPRVADRRFGVRDIQEGVTADRLYRSRLVNQVKSGWLVRNGNEIAVYACDGEVGRIHIDQIGPTLGIGASPAILSKGVDAKSRLEAIVGTGDKMNLSKLETTCEGRPATLVITGKAQDGLGLRAKTKEFLFHSPDRRAAKTGLKMPVPDDVWQDFLLIHDQNTGKNAQSNPNWEFWKPEFEAGKPVPVFFLPDGDDVSDMGTAQMFKLAMELSTHDLLRNSTGEHLDRQRFDLPSLIFGATGEQGGKDSWFAHNLKRRASFDVLRGPHRVENKEFRSKPEVLLAPKPNYYPIYVRQPAKGGNRIDNGEPYAAYHEMPGPDRERRTPELSGVKLWPANGTTGWSNDEKEEAIRNRLNLVPAGTVFEGCLRVHNLRPFELGALLWALTFGNKAALAGEETLLRHRLGLGKPLGAGELEIRVVGASLLRNDDAPSGSLVGMVDAFRQHMQDAYASRKPGADWHDSPQVAAVLQAADPARNPHIPRSYMQLDKPKVPDHRGKLRPGPDSYVGARSGGYFLPGYPDNSAPTFAPDTASELAADYPLEKGATVQLGQRRAVVQRILPGKHPRVEVQPLGGGRNETWPVSLLQVTAPPRK